MTNSDANTIFLTAVFFIISNPIGHLHKKLGKDERVINLWPLINFESIVRHMAGVCMLVCVSYVYKN
jgi:hypothetical protein